MPTKTNKVLYGIAGADKNYRVLGYFVIRGDDDSVWFTRWKAREMQEYNPSIKHIYLVDNRQGLYSEYQKMLKNPSIENCACFKDFLEREGIRIF